MSVPAPPGVAFLDVLASALIALLIIYLTAPGEDTKTSDAEQITFTILDDRDPDMSLVVCIGAGRRIQCSTDLDTGQVRFTATTNRISVFWPKDAFASKPGAWVALHSFGRLPPDTLHITVNRSGSPIEQVALEATKNFQSSDVLR